jgi:hypothetical protein
LIVAEADEREVEAASGVDGGGVAVAEDELDLALAELVDGLREAAGEDAHGPKARR